MLALDGPEISDAAADVGTDVFRNIVGDLQSAVIDRFLLLDIVERIETLNFAGEADRELFRIKLLDVIRATLAFHERGPGGLDRVPHGCNQAETGDDYATIQIQSSFCDKTIRTLPACLLIYRFSTLEACVPSRPSLCLVLIDVIVRIAHALNFLCVFVGNLDAEFFFETHHQLDRVERVGAEVIDKPGSGRDFVFVDTQLVNNDLLNFLLNLWIGHYILLL